MRGLKERVPHNARDLRASPRRRFHRTKRASIGITLADLKRLEGKRLGGSHPIVVSVVAFRDGSAQKLTASRP